MPWPRVLTLAAVVPAVLLAFSGVAGLVVSPTAGDAVYLTVILLAAGTSFVLAALLNRRLPESWMGPWVAANGAVAMLLVLDVYGAAAARRPEVLPYGGRRFEQAISGSWMLLYLPLALLLLTFPDGRLPGRGWRLVSWALPGVALAFNALVVTCTLATGTRPVATSLATPLPGVLLLLLLACGASVVVRYRRGDAATRVRLRWILLAGATVPLTLLLCWASYLFLGESDLVVLGLFAMFLAVPTAATTALLRGDRVDVDSVIVSTAAYAVIGAGLLAVLSATSAVAGLLVARVSTTAAVLVTALCMLAVPPVKRRLDHRLGRWLYPGRERALAALEDLRVGVHHGRAAPGHLEAVLRQALRDPALRIGYRPLDGGPAVGLDGAVIVPDTRTSVVRLGSEEIGVLVAGPAQAKPPPREVAEAAAFLVELLRLQRELRRALAEVDASRARMLRAGYEERRRLERDLHDGAQQRLVSLGVALRVLQRTHPGADGLTEALDEAVAEVGTAVAELRQIAHGLRPSSLDDGLGPALAGLIRRSPTPIDLQVSADGLPDEVTTTVYFVASEAVTNAVRHAEAGRIGVSVDREDQQVRVRVVDDGRGGAVLRPGAGLAGLKDRVAALGGRLHVSSAHTGTVIEAVLPCES
ncbi:MAG TPA: histidine kinase [Marmoricola sp.]|nr:histidine kinase [Marmoricola sp.]